MKLIPSTISLYVIIDDIIDFSLRQDIEKIISTPKFEFTIAIDPPTRYRYKFLFKTKDTEKFKRELALYSAQNEDLTIFYEENKGSNIVKSIGRIVEFVVSVRNYAFPLTAKIFIRVVKNGNIEKVLQSIHTEVLNADDNIPDAKLIQNSRRRYVVNLKIKSYSEFNTKFVRLKESRPDLDIFVV